MITHAAVVRWSRLIGLLLLVLLGWIAAHTQTAYPPYYRSLIAPKVLYIAPSTNGESFAEVLRTFTGAKVTFVALGYSDQDGHHLCDKPLEETTADLDTMNALGGAFRDAQLANMAQFDVVVASFNPKDTTTNTLQSQLVAYVRGGGRMVFINPSWEISFNGTTIAEVMPIQDGTAKAWTYNFTGATDHPITRGLPMETVGSHWYGFVYSAYDATCEPLTRNGTYNARFWYRRLPEGGQTVHCYQVGASRWQWGSSTNYANYAAERPDDGAAWQAFYPRLLYWLAYGDSAFPVLTKLAYADNASCAYGSTLSIPVDVENKSGADRTINITVKVSTRRSTRVITLNQQVTLAAGERRTVTLSTTADLPCADPYLQVKAQSIDPAQGKVLSESTAWLNYTARVPLTVQAQKSGLPGDPIPATVKWGTGAQPGSYSIRLLLVDNAGRIKQSAFGDVTVLSGVAGQWAATMTLPDWGPKFSTGYYLTALCYQGTQVVGSARAEVQVDRQWNMRSQLQWSLWTYGGDVRVMSLLGDGGFNTFGYPGSNQLADRYSAHQYVEGTDINTFGVTIDYDNWDAVRANMQAICDRNETNNGADSRTKSLVSLGEESGFSSGWGMRYYWSTDTAPTIPQKVFDDYLYERYNGDINVLNAEWGTAYASFADIPLTKADVVSPSATPATWPPDPAQPFMAMTAKNYESYNFFDWYYQKYCDLTTETYKARRNPVPLTIMSAPGGFYPKVDVYNFDGVGAFYPKETGLTGNAIARRDYGDVPGFSGAMWAYFDLRSLWSATVMSSVLAGNTHIDYWVDFPLTFNPDLTHTRASFWTRILTQQLHAIEPVLLHKRVANTTGLGMYIPLQPLPKGVSGNHFGSAIRCNAPLYSAMEESGYHPKVVKTSELANISVLFASYAEVVTPDEAAQLGQFVNNGGTLIVTPWLDAVTPHGNMRSVYPGTESGLAQLTGVSWLNTSQQPANTTVTVDLSASLPLTTPLTLTSRGFDKTVTIGGDVQVLARYADNTPLLVSRQVGAGKVVSLNMVYDWSNWWASFAEPSREAYRKLIDALIRADGRVSRDYYIGFSSAQTTTENNGWWGMVWNSTPAANESVPWWASQLYSDPTGTVKYLAIFADHRSPIITANIRMMTPGVRVFDLLNGGEITLTSGVTPLTLHPGEATLWAITPVTPTGISVSAPAQVTAGNPIDATVQFGLGGGAAPDFGVVVDVFGPDGAYSPAHSLANVTIPGGQSTVSIPTAQNDPPGNYRLVVTDCVTRRRAETTVTLQAPADLPDNALLGPFPARESDVYPVNAITDTDFLTELRTLRSIYLGSFTGLEAKYMLSYFLHVQFRPDNRHAIMRRLQRTTWMPHLTALADAIRAGENFYLVGEDLNIDEKTGQRIDPFAADSPSAFVSALGALPDAHVDTVVLNGITLDIYALGAGKLIVAHSSVDRTAYLSADFVTWHNALKAAFAGLNHPTVTLTSPVDGAIYQNVPASIPLVANASELGGAIARVEFYQGTTLLGTDTDGSDGWIYNWSNLAAGYYTLTAKAYDAAGENATSNAVTVWVGLLLNVKDWSWVPNVKPPLLPVPAPGMLPAGWTIDSHPSSSLVYKANNIECDTASNGVSYLSIERNGSNVTDGLTYTFPGQVTGDFIIEFDTLNNDMGAIFLDLRDAVGNSVITITAYNYAGARYISVNSNRWYFSGNPSYYGPWLQCPPYLSDIVPTYQWCHFKFVRTGTTYTLSATRLTNPGAPTGTTATWSVNGGAAPAVRSLRMNNASGWQWSSWANLQVLANLLPSANPDSYSTNEDTPLTVSAPGVLGNDSNPAGNPLTATKASDPAHGTVTVNSNGSFSYTPAADYYGPDSFTYTASNSLGWSATATVSLTVNAVNDVPSFTKGADQTVNENSGAQTVTGWATNIAAGPANESGQAVDFLVSNSNAALFSAPPAISPTGTLTYTPATNASGSATVTVRLHDDGTTANTGVDTSAAQTFTITVVNLPPTCAITAPANNAVYPTAPATVAITANAADPAGTVVKVEFFQGAALLGTDTNGADGWSYSWQNVPAGSYTLTAKATDNDQATATTTAVTIRVNAPPTVSLTAPANGVVYATTPATATLTASASDDTGIAKVEFYQGSTLLNTDTSAPYSYAWANVPTGSYTLTAKAYDSDGIVTTSTAVSIRVNAAPAVSLTSPANGATLTGSTVDLAATATDTDGTISKVEFYQGSTLLNTDTAAPYAYSWSGVAPGSYTLTARAYDSDGAVTTSSPVTITVGSGWTSVNVGATGLAGSTTINGNTMTVAGAGAGIKNKDDAFRFVYKQLTGDCTIIARVASMPTTNKNARAGVVIRQDLTTRSVEGASVLGPAARSAYFLYRIKTGNNIVSTSAPATTLPYWVKVVRAGTSVKGYKSADGVTWEQIGFGATFAMTDPLYLGLAVSSGSTTATVTATFDNISITTP